MTDRPILFSAPMVRALIDGRKTQTRRIIKRQPPLDAIATFGPEFLLVPGNVDLARFAKGDRLWVREAWRPDDRDSTATIYQADIPAEAGDRAKWHPSIHMHRYRSRLMLTVTDVRVERLKAITDADCLAEGIDRVADNYGNGPAYRDYGLPYGTDSAEWYARPIDSYRSLWVKINGAASWIDNPWVVAVTFTPEQRNHDYPVFTHCR